MILKSDMMWPALIVGMLLFNITASMTILYFATSDGGPEIIPDYYAQSVEFNQEMKARQASIDSGWAVTVEIDERQGTLRAYDAQDQPLTGLDGTVAFYRPQLAESLGTVDLEPLAGEPGHYRFDNIASQSGLWDLSLTLESPELIYVDRVRKNIY